MGYIKADRAKNLVSIRPQSISSRPTRPWTTSFSIFWFTHKPPVSEQTSSTREHESFALRFASFTSPLISGQLDHLCIVAAIANPSPAAAIKRSANRCQPIRRASTSAKKSIRFLRYTGRSRFERQSPTADQLHTSARAARHLDPCSPSSLIYPPLPHDPAPFSASALFFPTHDVWSLQDFCPSV